MKRFLVLAVLCVVPFVSAEAQRRRPTTPPNTQPTTPVATNFGDPLPGLSPGLLALFNAGRAEFNEPRTIDRGLGPVFNGRSCGECHNVPALGGGSPRTVTRIGTTANGVFDPLTRLGGSLLQDRAIGPREGSTHPFRPELVPAAATIVVRRRSTPMFGLGLVDATPDSTFIALAAQQAARNDGTAGRVSMVDNLAAGMRTVGKFGWKAQVPTLFQFSGDAALNELGITNPFFPDENCPSGNCAELQFNPRPGLNDSGRDVQTLVDFMSMLAAPPRAAVTADVTEGERVFERLGCDSCHVATLQTGAHPNPALSRIVYHPYSDFLLHDMGSLGDGIVQGDATARELRTAPLWGLRAMTTYLHDGRARTIEAAITAHDGQAAASRNRFQALSATDRNRLLAFLRSL